MDDKKVETGIVITDQTALVPETEELRVPLLEIARIIHENGLSIATNLYEASKDRFDDTHGGRLVDEREMRIYEEDRGGNRRSIKVYIGPKPNDPVELARFYEDMGFTDYPRLEFYYRQETSGNWVYNGAQVGVAGHAIGTRAILRKYQNEGATPKFLVEQTVNMRDFEDQLGSYLS